MDFQLLRHWTGRRERSRSAVRRSRLTRSLRWFETLEDRVLMTTAVWTGKGHDGLWNDSANWLELVPYNGKYIKEYYVPSGANDVVIGAHAGTITVTDGGAKSLSTASNLLVTSTLSTTGLSQLGSLVVNEGLAIQNNANVTLDYGAELNITGPQGLTGNGQVVFGPDSYMLAPGVADVNELVLGTNTSGGSVIGSGISITGKSGEISGSGVVNKGVISSTGSIVLGVASAGITPTFDNQGIVGASWGTLYIEGTFTPDVGGSFDITHAGDVDLLGTLDNTGNTLTVDTSHGSFSLDGGTIEGGTIEDTTITVKLATPAGTNLVLPIGTSGGGELEGVTLDSALAISNGATVLVAGGLTLNNTLTLNNGSALSFQTTQTLDGSGEIDFGPDSGTKGNRMIIGAGSLPFGGTAPAVTLTIGPSIEVSGASGEFVPYSEGILSGGPSTLVNEGTISSRGSIAISTGSFTNDGTVEPEPGKQVTISALSQNNATIESGGGSITISSNPFGNTGAVEADGGSITITSTFDDGGSADATDGGTLLLQGTQYVYGTLTATGGTITNRGSVYAFNAGEVDISDGGVLAPAGLAMMLNTTGPLSGLPGLPEVTGGGTFLLDGGTIRGGKIIGLGSLITVDENGGTLIGTTLGPDLDMSDGGTLVIRFGLTLDEDNVTLDGDPTWDFEGTQTLGGQSFIEASSGFTISVAGTTAPAATLTLGPDMIFSGPDGSLGSDLSIIGQDSDGLDTVVNQGQIDFDGITIQAGLFNNNGILVGSGSDTGDFHNAGFLSLLEGTFAITGDYTQEGTGSLQIDIGGLEPGTEYGQLDVTGTAALSGELGVVLVDGFTPSRVESFEVLSFGNQTGDFGAETGLALADGENLHPAYSPTALYLDDGFIVRNTEDSEPGSLRDILKEVNADPIGNGADTITFADNVAGATFTPASALPELTRNDVTLSGSATLDATSLPGDGLVLAGNDQTVQDLTIEESSHAGIGITGDDDAVTGSLLTANATGVDMGATASDNTVGGTAAADADTFTDNRGYGIVMSASSGNLVEQNFIGTDASSAVDAGNDQGGVLLTNGASENTIEGNVISGNYGYGITMSGSGTSGNEFDDNVIGVTNAAGTTVLPNALAGILIEGGASDNTVGGPTAASANTIAANKGDGVDILGAGTDDNVVAANDIGSTYLSASGLGNESGVMVAQGATGNTIGGTTAGSGNVIADNQFDGVMIGWVAADNATGNAVLENQIYGDTRLGIDLGQSGVIANDSRGHSGPNLFQDFPVITSVVSTAAGTTVTGTVHGPANSTLRVELFSNPSDALNGYGEGQTFLGALVAVPTDASGNGTFTFTTSESLAQGVAISATATDASGNTSEFSRDVPVVVSLAG